MSETPTPSQIHRGMLKVPSGFPREMFIKKLLQSCGTFTGLLGCHINGISSTGPIEVLRDEESPSEADEERDTEVGMATEDSWDVGDLEHEVIVKISFRGSKPKKTQLIIDGKPFSVQLHF